MRMRNQAHPGPAIPEIDQREVRIYCKTAIMHQSLVTKPIQSGAKLTPPIHPLPTHTKRGRVENMWGIVQDIDLNDLLIILQ